MNREKSNIPSWQTTLLVTAVVVVTVAIALLLAQADSYQRRSSLPANKLTISNPEATVAAGEFALVYLPSEVSPTPVITFTPTHERQPTDVVTPSHDVLPEEDVTPEAPIEFIDTTCDKAGEGWVPYIVKAGDSLPSLARRFKLSIPTIVEANCLSHERIIAGQQLALPRNNEGSPAKDDCEAPPGWAQYLVTSRDTLARLARAHGTTVSRLMEANCLKSGNLIAGQRIFLPLNTQ